MGRGRRARRALAEGGTGVAKHLNEAIAGWPGVRITPMFGRWGYFIGERLFACFPLGKKERDLWIHLSQGDQKRALTAEWIRPHRRFAGRGWIETDVESARDVARALRWLRRAYASVARGVLPQQGEED